MGEIETSSELMRETFASGYPYNGSRYGLEMCQKVYLKPLAGYPPFEKLIAPQG